MIDKIFLIGYRATGKSTIGRELASRLGFSFLDMDSLIRQKCNSTIEQIVADLGWTAFRKIEAEALQESFRLSRVVVATGGGAILHRDIWEQHRGTALVVWLTAEISELSARLGGESGGAGRPTLTGQPIDLEIAEVLEARTPLYMEYSDITIDTGEVSVTAAVDSIVIKFQKIMAGV